MTFGIAMKEVWDAEFSWKSRQPLGITTSIPYTQGQLQNVINSHARDLTLSNSLAAFKKMQFQTFIITSNHTFALKSAISDTFVFPF